MKRELDSQEKRVQLEQALQSVLGQLETSNERRFIKTHLPFSLLPPDLISKGCKVVYVARNPLDVAVSYYHLHRGVVVMDFVGDFAKFWNYFQRNLISWCPYWTHIKEGWERRHENNVLFMFYEDMVKVENIEILEKTLILMFQDLRSAIQSMSHFLGKKFTADEMDKLQNHLKFDNFKNNKVVTLPMMNEIGFFKKDAEKFVRKGRSGGWKEYFNEEQANEAERWMEENQKAIGIKFKM